MCLDKNQLLKYFLSFVCTLLDKNCPLRNRCVWVNHILYASFHANVAILQPKLRNVTLNIWIRQTVSIWNEQFLIFCHFDTTPSKSENWKCNKCTGIWVSAERYWQFIGRSVSQLILTKCSILVIHIQGTWHGCSYGRFLLNHQYCQKLQIYIMGIFEFYIWIFHYPFLIEL